MAVEVEGDVPAGVTAKDIALAIIGRLGTGGGIGHVIEYRGAAIRALSMEGRMTVCNMSIEAGARAGMVAPDDMTFAYLRRTRLMRPQAPTSIEAVDEWRDARHRRRRQSSTHRHHRRRRRSAARDLGHKPRAGGPHRRRGPRSRTPSTDPGEREAAERALATWASTAGHRDRATSPSTRCSSARAPTAASRTCERPPRVLDGRHVRSGLRALVVPGSHRVKNQAEAEGLDKMFRRGRLRVARAGLLDVPRDEPGQARSGRARARRPRTGTSKDARAEVGGPTSSPPPSPPPPPSPATSPRPRTWTWNPSASSPGDAVPSTAPTSTPTRSSRPTG